MNKFLYGVFAALALTLFSASTSHAAGWAGEPFRKIVYFEHGGKGAGSGNDAGNAKAIVDADVMAIEAGTVIEKAFVVIDTAITGTTNLDVGDDDDADGFVDGSLSVTLGTAGMYGWDVKNAGAYLRVQTAGATDAADIYVVPNAKFYSAAGKEVKLDVTTASTAGKFRVIVEGYKLK
jgi:hypothetical protein